MGALDVEVIEERPGVLRQIAGRVPQLARHVGLAHTAIVEGDDVIARREVAHLEEPPHAGSAESADEEHGVASAMVS